MSDGVEGHRQRLDHAVALDEGPARPVEHHLGDRGIGQDRFEHPEADRLVHELGEQRVEPVGREQRFLDCGGARRGGRGRRPATVRPPPGPPRR